MKRIVIIGSRRFEDYSLLEEKLDKIHEDGTEPVELGIGYAIGVNE